MLAANSKEMIVVKAYEKVVGWTATKLQRAQIVAEMQKGGDLSYSPTTNALRVTHRQGQTITIQDFIQSSDQATVCIEAMAREYQSQTGVTLSEPEFNLLCQALQQPSAEVLIGSGEIHLCVKFTNATP